MSHSTRILNEVRAQLAPTRKVLDSARSRRTAVLEAVLAFEGALRTYRSGSIAHGTANSDTDADGGVVLDRRVFTSLGPDGGGGGPTPTVERVASLVEDALRERFSGLSLQLTKRAIQVNFDDPVDGEDPSVDLIVALSRRSKPGLWIPNLHTDSWDASDPEKHTALFTAGSELLKRVRARSVRLGKGWNVAFPEPGMCSFNIEALAWMVIEGNMSLPEALLAFFRFAAQEVRRGPTADPAGVSEPIKLKVAQSEMVRRLEGAAVLMREAVEHDGDEGRVRTALSRLFPDYVEPPAGKSRWAEALREGNAGVSVGIGGIQLGDSGPRLKTTRSYGSNGED